MKIVYAGTYLEMLAGLLVHNDEIEFLIKETIVLFQNNPSDTRLRVHPLTRRLKGKWGMGVLGDKSGDMRVVFEWLGVGTVRFLGIGSHTVVYGKKKMEKYTALSKNY